MSSLLLAVSVLLIALNGLFVLVEFALVRVRSSHIEMLARRGNWRAVQVKEILAHLDMYLAAIQMGITTVSLALGWIGEPALADILSRGLRGVPVLSSPRVVHGLSFAAALILLSLAHIVLGEVVPRSIGIQKPEAVSLWGAYPLRAFFLMLRLPVAFVSFCSVSILRLLGFKRAAEAESVVTEDEVRILLGETQEKGALPLERLFLLENLFDLAAAKAGEVMTPMDKASWLSLSKPWEENREAIRARRHSRFLLCEDGPESIVGMVHVKDILLKGGDPPDLRALRRELPEVSEHEPLEKLIKTFPDKGIHFALVRGAAGKPAGIITLEDIIEELIGEVQDEFDLPQAWSLADAVVPAAVAVQLAAPDREVALREVLARLVAAVPSIDEKGVFKAVWDREQKFSSAIGRGLAVPHARLPGLERPLIALGRFQKAVPFPAPDSIPVRLVFLILTPASQPIVQLKVLARIASLALNENLRRKLLRAKTAEAMLDVLRTGDTLLAA